MLEDKDIIYENFNRTLYSKIYSVRKSRGMTTCSDYCIRDVEDHPYKGKMLIEKNTGKVRYIQSVHKHWEQGYYYGILYYSLTENGGKSHGTLIIQNINSKYDFVIKQIEKNIKKYKII